MRYELNFQSEPFETRPADAGVRARLYLVPDAGAG